MRGIRHSVKPPEVATTAYLDWAVIAQAGRAAMSACAAAGIGGLADSGTPSPSDWHPQLIFGADVCYTDEMGDAVLDALAYLLAAAPPGARAVIINGWPNRGLRRFETLIGARDSIGAGA